MYEPGKVFNAAGTGSSTGRSDTAEIIDLNMPTPVWTPVAPLPGGGRRDVNGTILPDGQVLVTGGQKEVPGTPVIPSYQTELWNPATKSWTVLAPEPAFRAYHSVAILLPDGRVLSAGGVTGGAYGDIFSPPYLFKGPRPTITSAPVTSGYNSMFFVGTPDAASIAQVTLVRLSSVTHGFNESQRFNRLNFTIAGNGLNVTTPSGPRLAPPGYYMLFILNNNGVPSVSKLLRLQSPQVMPTPTAPTALKSTAINSTSVSLAWDDASDNEAGFKVERSTDGLRFTQIALVPADSPAFSSANLTSGTKYFFRVRAYNAGDSSAYSNVVEITTLPDVPTAPVGLTASGITTSTINLSWTDGSTNESGFKIERSTDNIAFVEIGFTAADVTTFSNSSLPAGTRYYYRVRASNATGDSAYSNVAEATTLSDTPTAPSSLAASAISSSRVDLQWTDSSTNETGFKVERSTDGTNFSQLATVGRDVTTYSSRSLTADTKYYYRVRAYNAAGDSGYSPIATATPPSLPLAPTDLTAFVDSSRRVVLSWKDNAFNEVNVRIYRSLDGVTYTRIGTAPGNGAHRDDTPAKGQTNYYRVAAYNAAGESNYSNVVQVIP